MPKLRIDYSTCPPELLAGLRQIEAQRPEALTSSPRAPRVKFIHTTGGERPGFAVTYERSNATVRYARPCDAFRALGRLLGLAQAGAAAADFAQECQFDWMALQVDYARNGVLRLQTAKRLLCHLALLGFNGFIPYMEDGFEVPGEPFFGYMRGRYTQAQLKELDDFAFNLGIEAAMHIQTLGHFSQLLQWPVYAHLRDQPTVLMAGYEPSYQLLEKMIRAATTPFRSRRFFPGLDEAHGLGLGRYRHVVGQKAPFAIFTEHVRWLCDLCKKLGLRPASSGDMYFRLASKDDWYYDEEAVVPPEVIAQIPPEMKLIYWDFYHTDAAFYQRWIQKHRAMGKEPMVSGGIWTWCHFWAQLPFSMNATQALMAGCRASKLREVICCIWGDDGMQCDPYSALPGLTHFAELAYAPTIDQAGMRAQLRGAAGIEFDDFLRASDIDLRSDAAAMAQMPDNPSVFLLWDDPFLGLLQPQNENPALASHHRQLAHDLAQAAKKPGLSKRLRFPAQIAKVLSIKIDLRRKIVAALAAKDKAALQTLLTTDLAPLRREVEKLWKIHRDMWLATYRPFGLEVIEARYGGLLARLQSLADRLKDYLAGKIDSIPELAAPLLKIFPTDDIYLFPSHQRASTASAAR